MTNVLVLVEHGEGQLKNSTVELITAARVFGTVGAVVVGAPGTTEKLQERTMTHSHVCVCPPTRER